MIGKNGLRFSEKIVLDQNAGVTVGRLRPETISFQAKPGPADRP
jgi:hypothetical protein